MNILIAEDTASDRLLLRLRLEKLGHVVDEVSNGDELVEHFRASKDSIDLVIVDLNMPVKSGAEAVSEIRAAQGTYEDAWVPIIVLSGSESDDDVERCIEAGADDYLVKPIQHKVLAAKLLAMSRIANMRHRLVKMNRRLEALSTTDYLTDLPNRRAFERTLSEEMSKSLRHQQALSVAVLDIDHFKDVNDTYGHDVGDWVLQEMSRRLTEARRSGDEIGRVGGEEFGLCLPHSTGFDAHKACERYRTVVCAEPFVHQGQSLTITVSLGVCEYKQFGTQLELIKKADLALYQAKDAGRNCTVLYKEDI